MPDLDIQDGPRLDEYPTVSRKKGIDLYPENLAPQPKADDRVRGFVVSGKLRINDVPPHLWNQGRYFFPLGSRRTATVDTLVVLGWIPGGAYGGDVPQVKSGLGEGNMWITLPHVYVAGFSLTPGL